MDSCSIPRPLLLWNARAVEAALTETQTDGTNAFTICLVNFFTLFPSPFSALSSPISLFSASDFLHPLQQSDKKKGPETADPLAVHVVTLVPRDQADLARIADENSVPGKKAQLIWALVGKKTRVLERTKTSA